MLPPVPPPPPPPPNEIKPSPTSNLSPIRHPSSSSDASSSSHAPPESIPLLVPNPSFHLSSQPKTFANVFIAIVGAGVLGLPYTFSRTGWAAGLVMLLAVGFVTYYCMMLLVLTRRRLDSDPPEIASYGDLGFAVFGSAGRVFVDVMIVISQAGFCVGYLIFMSDTLAHLFRVSIFHLSPKSFYVLSILPFQLILNSIPTLTRLAPLSIFADLVCIGAMVAVLAEDAIIYREHPPTLMAFGPVSVILYGLGVAVFAFEGVGMVLPLESEAADKPPFGRTLGVSMAVISVLYGLFGATGYMAFGDETRDIITTNFHGGAVALVVQIGLVVSLFFTFPIMMNPVYEVGERWLCGKRYCLWLRWAAVVAVSLVALFVPNFADFLSLVGSSVCCVLGFVLPAGFHLRVFRAEMGWLEAAWDWTIVVVGTVFVVSGTYTSLVKIFFSR